MRRYFLFILSAWPLFSGITCHAQAGMITTIAGNGIAGYNGDTIDAVYCEFDSPGGIAVDPVGNVYIADENNQRIRKIALDGEIYTSFYIFNSSSQPKNIVLNAMGSVLYIADRGNNKIWEADLFTGFETPVAGFGTSPGYNGDGIPATTARLYFPYGVTVDNAGNVYLADSWNNRVRKVNIATGIITTIAGNGSQGYTGDGDSAIHAELNFPSGLAFDTAGNLYIADNNNHVIRMINASGIISTVAGNGNGGYSGDEGPATAAQLYNPNCIAIDATGSAYIADQNNHRIRKVNTSGIITTVAGNGSPGFSGDGGPAADAMLHFPAAVAVDAAGNMYIADQYNNRIRKVTNPAAVASIAGEGDLSIYPNPASDILTVRTKNERYSSYVITNELGQVRSTGNITSPVTTINVTPLAPSMYYLLLKGENGTEVRKFIK